MLKFIQNNREITALLAVVLLFVLPGFLDRQYLSVQTLTMVYSSAHIPVIEPTETSILRVSITSVAPIASRIFTTCCLCRDFTAWFARGIFQRCPGRVAKDPCHCCHPWHVRVVQRHHVAVDWRQMD